MFTFAMELPEGKKKMLWVEVPASAAWKAKTAQVGDQDGGPRSCPQFRHTIVAIWEVNQYMEDLSLKLLP